jgi:hypothetical protein
MPSSVLARVNTFLLALLMLMALSIIALLAHGAIGGPLDPPGAPASTHALVEPRYSIPPVNWDGSFPIHVGNEGVGGGTGSYYLTKNILELFGSAPAIEIDQSDITLDLNGFTVQSIGTQQSGIVATNGLESVTVESGTVRGWSAGIDLGNVDEVTVHDVTAFLNGYGMKVGSGAMISRVTVTQSSIDGIDVGDPNSRFEGGVIEDSTITKNADDGIRIGANNVTVRRNVLDSNALRGVDIQNSFDVVTDNSVQGSSQCIHDNGNSGTGSSTIVRNIVGNCSSETITRFVNGTDHVGPAVAGANLTTSDPWSNVEY